MFNVTRSSNAVLSRELISRLNGLERQARSLSLYEYVDWSGIQAAPKGPTQSISNSHLGCQLRPAKNLWSGMDISRDLKPP
jgi:hypothetical protein